MPLNRWLAPVAMIVLSGERKIAWVLILTLPPRKSLELALILLFATAAKTSVLILILPPMTLLPAALVVMVLPRLSTKSWVLRLIFPCLAVVSALRIAHQHDGTAVAGISVSDAQSIGQVKPCLLMRNFEGLPIWVRSLTKHVPCGMRSIHYVWAIALILWKIIYLNKRITF